MTEAVISIHSLLAAIISRAIEDLKETGPKCSSKEPDRAMAFILSETCEAYCLELQIDYEAIREKGAALYRLILEKEKPALRYLQNPRSFRLLGKRHINIFKQEATDHIADIGNVVRTCPSSISTKRNGQPSARRSV